jgi:oligosaccharide repeat unit polymerase
MSTVTGKGRNAMAVLLALSIGITAIATGEIQSAYASGQSWAPLIAFMCAAWLACFLASSWLYFGSPYLFSTAYLMVLAVFHLGLLIPYGLGIVNILAWQGDEGRWIRLAGWYTALAFATFGIGFAFTCLQKPARTVRLTAEQEALVIGRNFAKLRNLATGLAVAAILGLLITMLRLGNLLAFTRFDLFFRSGDPRWLSLFMFLGPTAALALVATARTRTQKTTSYIFGTCMLALTLLSGERSRALFPLLMGAVLWVKLGRRIPHIVAAGMIMAVLLVIPLIGMLRTLGSYNQLSAKDVEQAQQHSTVINALGEMGSTLGVLSVTLKHIPSEEPYRLGQPFLIYLRQSIPNVGLSANYEYARTTLFRKLRSNPRAVLELEPSEWTSWKVLPERFLAGQGTGFSGIAEPYFSFGYGGVVVWFILLGAFLARMDLVDMRLNYNWLVFGTLFFWNFPVTCRNSFGVFTKPAALILTALAIWIVVRRFTPFREPVQRQHTQVATR